jgi:hypothetical protein
MDDIGPGVEACALVQRQLEACDARDVEAFMACWAADAQLFAFPSSLLADGAEAIRRHHVERFKEPRIPAVRVSTMSTSSSKPTGESRSSSAGPR